MTISLCIFKKYFLKFLLGHPSNVAPHTTPIIINNFIPSQKRLNKYEKSFLCLFLMNFCVKEHQKPSRMMAIESKKGKARRRIKKKHKFSISMNFVFLYSSRERESPTKNCRHRNYHRGFFSLLSSVATHQKKARRK